MVKILWIIQIYIKSCCLNTKKLLGHIEIGIKILERLREENSKEVKLFQAISFLCVVDEMKALSWKIIDNTQDSSLAEYLKHIVSDYSEYTGTMEKLLKSLIESKVYSFTVGKPVDKDALSKYFLKSSERVYFYDLPPTHLFGEAGYLGIYIDKMIVIRVVFIERSKINNG